MYFLGHVQGYSSIDKRYIVAAHLVETWGVAPILGPY